MFVRRILNGLDRQSQGGGYEESSSPHTINSEMGTLMRQSEGPFLYASGRREGFYAARLSVIPGAVGWGEFQVGMYNTEKVQEVRGRDTSS